MMRSLWWIRAVTSAQPSAPQTTALRRPFAGAAAGSARAATAAAASGTVIALMPPLHRPTPARSPAAGGARLRSVRPVDAADFERLGVYHPGAADAGDRLRLLTFLAQHGASADELVAAESTGRLGGLATELAIRGG